jgi:zona occludens toxin
MIELRTGVPGSGKSLSMVQALARTVARWEKHPEEARPVFVRGIPELKLPHSPMPGKLVKQTNGEDQFIPAWEEIPDGSLILFDEAQGTFPPRSSASLPPKHVAFLNIHRHKGLDIWVTTQHPKLIDHSLRALVGKHRHYRRLFGRRRAIVYEWDACSDSLAGTKNAVTSYWSYPTKVFDWYKSAEIHTKQSFKLPFWVVIPFIAIAIGIFSIPSAYRVLTNGVQGKSLSAKDSSSAQTSKTPSKEKQQAPVAPPPPVSTATQVVEVRPEYVGCVASKEKCSCMTSTGITILEPPMCRESANGFGHLIKVAMAGQSVQPSYGVPVAPAHVEKAETRLDATLSNDGFGVLGAAPVGVRKPGQ